MTRKGSQVRVLYGPPKSAAQMRYGPGPTGPVGFQAAARPRGFEQRGSTGCSCGLVPRLFQGDADAFPDTWEEVAVGVDRGLDVGVAEVLHDLILLGSLADQEGDAGVPKVVE